LSASLNEVEGRTWMKLRLILDVPPYLTRITAQRYDPDQPKVRFEWDFYLWFRLNPA